MKLAPRKLGWIGVDVGTSALKIAQVARDKRGWRLVASAVVPRQANWSTDRGDESDAISSLSDLEAARSLQQGYQGRSVAAALPMSLCDLHRVDRDLQREANPGRALRQIVETSTQQSAEHLQCDFWSAPAAESKPGWSHAITVPRSWSTQLAEDVCQAGWSCQAVDALPLAMTRAVNLVYGESSDAPVMALDWGSGCATLCFIEQGQPSYVRCLKACGLSRSLDALVDNLQVTSLEAQRLLEEYSVATHPDPEFQAIAELVREIVTDSLSQLTSEIQRSIGHFQYLCKASRPKELVLFGGGAMIEQMDRYLSAQLKLPVSNWQLRTQDSKYSPLERNDDCLFGTAIGLSALAWEGS